MFRLFLLIGLSTGAALFSLLLRKTTSRDRIRSGWTVPGHLERSDFAFRNEPWIALVFSSNTCETCKSVIDAAKGLSIKSIPFQEISVEENKELHDRYGIDAVPMLLILDNFGVVRSHYLGPVALSRLEDDFDEIILQES
tara:strand:+ start:115 stop:534 length:420 start_codon:yes stop_codon:yes gene_type:complete